MSLTFCKAGWNTDIDADMGKKCSFIFSQGGRVCVCVGRSGVGRGCSLPGKRHLLWAAAVLGWCPGPWKRCMGAVG